MRRVEPARPSVKEKWMAAHQILVSAFLMLCIIVGVHCYIEFDLKSMVHEDYALESTFVTWPANDYAICAQFCAMRRGCTSFNFIVASKQCEMNRDTDQALVDRPGSHFSEIHHWAQILGPCAEKICPSMTLCVKNPVNASEHICIPIWCSGDLPAVAVAKIVSTVSGKSATYDCKYKRFYKGVGNNVVNCTEVGLWGDVTFTCELRGNLALNRPAKQSSTAYGGVPERAVDGITNSDYHAGSCVHTSLENNPWWEVDLGDIYRVGQVMLVNRHDCCAELLHSVKVEVGQTINTMILCASRATAFSYGEHYRFYCPEGMTGRFVRITLEAESHLVICEVEVYEDGCFTGSSLWQGSQSHTSSGYVCQRWDSQYPHGHGLTSARYFPDSSMEEVANFCRDPDGEGAPWCYTTDLNTRWEYCGVPHCDNANLVP